VSTSPLTVSDTTLDRYLGPARVVRHVGESHVVALESGTVVHATRALAFPYDPRVGDNLLVIGDARAFWIIGVLAGRGRTRLSGRGGVSLHAESGRLKLVGDRGVKLAAHRLVMHTDHLRRLALTAMHTFGELRSQVREGLKVEAAEIDELSQKRWLLQARRVVLKALLGARVKSTTVRLG
jgi:hypothetical protein